MRNVSGRRIGFAGNVLVLTSLLAACGGSDQKEKVDWSDVGGYGDAILALSSVSTDVVSKLSSMHGSVILVESDGTFRAMETSGIENAQLGFSGDVLYASDIEADYRISGSDAERTERGKEIASQEDAVATSEGLLTVFNTGVGDDGEYYSDLILDDGTNRISGRIPGELWNVSSCGGNTLALLSSWQTPGRDLRLVRLVPDADASTITVEDVAAVNLPKGSPDQAVLGCSKDTWFVLQDRGPKRMDFLGEFTLAGSEEWTELEVGGDPGWGVAMCGTDGERLVLLDASAREIKLTDVSDGSVERLMDLPKSAEGSRDGISYTCRMHSDVLLLSSQNGGYGDPSYFWYDTEGTMLHEVTVTGLGRFLRDSGERETGTGVPLSMQP